MNPNTPFEWRGRVDAEETGVSTRWHQHVRPAAADSRGGVTLIGFAVDEGVRRNAGRTGAALGPQALRGALANLSVLGEPALWDAGDVTCEGNALEAAQTQLGERVAGAMARDSLPLGLGGGHEMAWGTFQGIVKAHPDASRLLVVNLDAHFDLRVAAQANSGTPFHQMHDWCTERGQAFNYRVFGISRFANTQALFDRAHAMGVRYWLDDSLQDANGLRDAQQALAIDLARSDAVYLTVCLDVLPGAQAPGVSAPAPLGVPLAQVERLIDQVLGSGRVVAADIAELNPSLDRDGLTARVAARLAARIARSRTT
ncbi:formimidoylglutamase [Rhodoferax sp.]|uniref:formimidoylglutamase n=1 Tax=Rhodoferax sp. TaxID=50421 RepID=UPI0025EB9A46|nr:formimidoylglutamase [Rhodoferax sp.]MCM2340216.1 formimidoylglutamase [Rhodoferax sp.]